MVAKKQITNCYTSPLERYYALQLETCRSIQWRKIKETYKIIKYKTNYSYSIGDYTVINWIIESALS